MKWTEDYYKKSSYLDLDFIKDIDGFMDTLLTIDDVLDRINDVGLDKINLLELSFLERNSSKF